MLSVKVNSKELERFLKQMNAKQKSMKPLFVWMSGVLQTEVIKNFRLQSSPPDILSGPPGNTRKAWTPQSSLTKATRVANNTTGGILQASGKLFGSIGKVRIIKSKSMEWGTSEALAAVHHFGATIRPKRAKYLAIPYPGVTGRPRDYKNTFFAKKSMFQSQEDGTVKPLFMLKDEVKIPARPFMTVSNSVIFRFQDATAKYILGKFRL